MGLRFPKQFVSVYEMVSFSHTPYDTAIKCIQAQDALLQQIMAEGNFFENINDSTFINKLEGLVTGYHTSVQQLDFGK